MARASYVPAAPRVPALLGRAFLIIGLAALAAAVYFAGTEWRSHRTAAASGKVVAVGSLPALEFTMADGSIIRSINTGRDASLHVGDSVAVAYDPANPSDAVIDGILGRWFPAALAALIGGVLILLGSILRLKGRRR